MSAVSSALASSLATSDLKSNVAPLRMRHPDFTTTGTPESESSGDDYSDGEGETTAVEGLGDENYVRRVLSKERPLPPITLRNWYKEINVISTLALTVVPALAFYGAMTTKIRLPTFIWAVV